MKAIFILIAIFAIANATPWFRNGRIVDTKNAPVNNPELIKYINGIKSTWKATNHKMWEGWSIERVKKLMGTHLYTATNEPRKSFSPDVLKALPPSFDSRENWPKCDTIGTILNQAECGSCWAFACVESISDRFCINSNASINVALSETDLVTCDFEQGGCEGGDPFSAWCWVITNGLVSNACSPYTIPTCPPQEQPCLNFVNTPNCVKQCVNNQTWSSSKKYLSQAYYLSSNQLDIAAEIVAHGPVEAAFSVYEDFLHYKSGVYVHESGAYVGGHAVKIIGYGTENGTPYWLIANSWTTYWGNKGFFKMLRGADECGIESGVVGGTPDLSRL